MFWFDLLAIFTALINIRIPEISLIIVKLAASMVFSPSANRQRTELAAKAKSAKLVHVIIFM